jgi:hypothetical protein
MRGQTPQKVPTSRKKNKCYYNKIKPGRMVCAPAYLCSSLICCLYIKTIPSRNFQERVLALNIGIMGILAG